jgi:hypothetical protein
MISTWLEEDCPSFDYGGFVVGEAHGEAKLLGKSKVWIWIQTPWRRRSGGAENFASRLFVDIMADHPDVIPLAMPSSFAKNE